MDLVLRARNASGPYGRYGEQAGPGPACGRHDRPDGGEGTTGSAGGTPGRFALQREPRRLVRRDQLVRRDGGDDVADRIELDPGEVPEAQALLPMSRARPARGVGLAELPLERRRCVDGVQVQPVVALWAASDRTGNGLPLYVVGYVDSGSQR